MSLLALIPLAEKVVDYFSDDSENKAEAKKIVEQMKNAKDEREASELFAKLNALAASDKNQTEINKIEAASASKFKSGWRPMIGWVCACGFAYAVVLYPILVWIAKVSGMAEVPPNLDSSLLYPTMMGMLGLGAYRSFEKNKGLTK